MCVDSGRGNARRSTCHDYDADHPAVARALKDAIAAADAVLFVTPEYDRSLPGGLKNAIGTALAQQTLCTVPGFCDSPLMSAPEAYIQFEPGLVAEDGTVTVESTRECLAKFMQAFHARIERCAAVPAPGA